jgi:ABC-type antimicrobial peptide transport system permease subunit
MFKNYLLITVRSLLKNKVFILINIFGMAIAIACCIVAYFNYDFNASFDSHHANAGKIYRISTYREYQNKLTKFGYVPMPLGDVVRQNVGDVGEVIRFSPSGMDIRIGDDIFATGVAFVDEDFFKVFTFKFKEGDPTGLKDKSKIYINETLATKYFGNAPAVGKTITQILPENVTKEFTIAGVFYRQPENSSFNDEAFVRYDNVFDDEPVYDKGRNWFYRNNLFVTLADPSRIPAIEAQLAPYAENNNKIREDFFIKSFKLEPFAGMAVRDEADDVMGNFTREGSPIAAVVGVGVMGIFILLIACFNLTNTTVAVSSQRLKEIGIRKVMGSQRAQLVAQFLGETMFVCFVALLLGMVIAETLLLPAFNQLWEYMKLEANYTDKPDFLVFLIATLVCTAILAGSYPALYITRFQPVSILKGKLKFGGTNYFTRALLFLQYGISLIAVVSSLAFIENARYQRDFDLGFTQAGVVYTNVANGNEWDVYRNALTGDPIFKSIAGSKNNILPSTYNDPVKHEGREIEVDIIDAGENYISTAGLTLKEGRDFVRHSKTDLEESIIISEKFAESFGWDKPIGKEILWLDSIKLYVVGVVKNTYTRGIWKEMQPVMIRYVPQDEYRFLLVSTAAADVVEANAVMEKKWKEVFPNRQYVGHYMDEEMAESAQINNNIVKMFAFLGIVAMMLSATGLFTLVSLNIIKRTKEIGVRKVLGASVGNIARVINTEFVIILLLASVFGMWAGAALSEMLMASIWKYYQPATVFSFVVSTSIMFSISMVTIGYKIYSTATMNPVKTLRDE